MQSSYFQAKIDAKRSADGEVKLGWGQTSQSDTSIAATEQGHARLAKREAKVAESDLVDKTLPSVTGTVVSVAKGNGNWSSLQLGVAATTVKVDPEGISTFALPSGAVCQVTPEKLKQTLAGGEKRAMPHTFPPECAIVFLNGVIKIDVKCIKNGPNERELKETDVPIGTQLTLKDVVFSYNYTPATDRYPARCAAYGSCKSIEYDETFCKGPSHPREQKAAIFDALQWKSNGAHMQVINAVCDHVGKRPDALLEVTRKDKESLAAQMEAVLDKHHNAFVGVGQPWETPLFGSDPDATIAAWRNAIQRLRDPANVSLNLLHAVHPTAMMRSQIFPIVQYPMDPITATLTDRHKSGLSVNVDVFTTPEFCDLADPLNPFVSNNIRCFAEATVALAAEKRRRPEPTADMPDPVGMRDEDITSKSMGSIALDVTSFAFAIRADDGSPFKPHLLKTKEGATVVIQQCLDSVKKGNIVSKHLGVYDYYRVWMVCNEIAPYVPMVHYTANWNNEKPVDEIVVQPKCENGWGNDGLTNVFDVATAVESVGVQVTREFLEEHAVDEERQFFTPDPAINYVAEDGKDKKPVPHQPPKLNVHGYVCLNGLPETSINRASAKKLPEGSDGFKLFVVYEGCADDVKNSIAPDATGVTATNISKDAEAGSRFLVTKFGDELRGKLANMAAIYCVATPPAPIAAKKQRTA